jgi:hypothetical protein
MPDIHKDSILQHYLAFTKNDSPNGPFLLKAFQKKAPLFEASEISLTAA